ncbi:MAG: hypothetical protein AB7W16_09295 [Candidatus Obscuribacterales bacterium]
MTKRIVDIRVYESSDLSSRSIPEWNVVRDQGYNAVPTRFALKLRELGFTSTTWYELYINLTEDLDYGTISSRGNGDQIVIVDFGVRRADVNPGDLKTRNEFSIETICKALSFLSKDYCLDMNLVNLARSLLEKHGKGLEVIALRKENRNFLAIVSFTVLNDGRLFLSILDKRKEQWSRKEICRLRDPHHARVIASRLSIVGEEIRVFSRVSEAARYVTDTYFEDLYHEDLVVKVKIGELSPVAAADLRWS